MQIGRKIIMIAASSLLFMCAMVVEAQVSNGNITSPYTIYGLGRLDGDGTTATQSMSGVSVAMRNPFTPNVTNPAALSVAQPQSMLYTFGMKGTNDYLKNSTGQTSSNEFNMGDISAQFPIAKGIGFGFNFSSYSTVGYDVSIAETDQETLDNVGEVSYRFLGNGGISRIKAGIGMEVVNGLSLGVSGTYYLGTINRLYETAIFSYIDNERGYRSYQGVVADSYSMVVPEFGLQYDVKLRYDKHITIGAVYQPKIVKDVERSVYDCTVSDALQDSVRFVESSLPFFMPEKYSAGIAYRTPKFSIGVDYNYQDWRGAMTFSEIEGIGFNVYQDVKVGMEYVPNRFDIRKALKRWTYRAGFKYAMSYMTYLGNDIEEYSGSFGVGIPTQRGEYSLINVGVEAGTRGSILNGLTQETFVTVHLGISLFTVQEWFVRHKFK